MNNSQYQKLAKLTQALLKKDVAVQVACLTRLRHLDAALSELRNGNTDYSAGEFVARDFVQLEKYARWKAIKMREMILTRETVGEEYRQLQRKVAKSFGRDRALAIFHEDRVKRESAERQRKAERLIYVGDD